LHFRDVRVMSSLWSPTYAYNCFYEFNVDVVDSWSGLVQLRLFCFLLLQLSDFVINRRYPQHTQCKHQGCSRVLGTDYLYWYW